MQIWSSCYYVTEFACESCLLVSQLSLAYVQLVQPPPTLGNIASNVHLD